MCRRASFCLSPIKDGDIWTPLHVKMGVQLQLSLRAGLPTLAELSLLNGITLKGTGILRTRQPGKIGKANRGLPWKVHLSLSNYLPHPLLKCFPLIHIKDT